MRVDFALFHSVKLAVPILLTGDVLPCPFRHRIGFYLSDVKAIFPGPSPQPTIASNPAHTTNLFLTFGPFIGLPPV